MFRGKVILPSLLGLALILSLVSSAEAGRWRFNFFGLHIYGYSPRSVVHGYSSRSGVDRRNVTNVVETERVSTGGGAVGALLDRLVRGCLQQAAEFQSWPYEAINGRFASEAKSWTPNRARLGAQDGPATLGM